MFLVQSLRLTATIKHSNATDDPVNIRKDQNLAR